MLGPPLPGHEPRPDVERAGCGQDRTDSRGQGRRAPAPGGALPLGHGVEVLDVSPSIKGQRVQVPCRLLNQPWGRGAVGVRAAWAGLQPAPPRPRARSAHLSRSANPRSPRGTGTRRRPPEGGRSPRSGRGGLRPAYKGGPQRARRPPPAPRAPGSAAGGLSGRPGGRQNESHCPARRPRRGGGPAPLTSWTAPSKPAATAAARASLLKSGAPPT